jgi:hypothetical protein
MNDNHLANLLMEMCDMATAIAQGCQFVEISTYLRNHIPGITDAEIELFRDILNPVQQRRFK